MNPLDRIHNALDMCADRGVSADTIATLRTLVDSVPTAKNGTMRAWFEARDGQSVETLQLDYGEGLWAPGPRRIDASKASYATFDGSRREYRGCSVIGCDENILAIEYVESNDIPSCVIIYKVVK